MYFYIPRRAGWVALRTFIVVAAIFLSLVILGSFFFFFNQSITKSQLKNTLTSIAAVGAMQFDAEALVQIHDREDMETPEFLDAVFRLHTMRQNLPHVRHAYIMRKTDNAEYLAFVADADLFLKSEPVDENGNGIIDPEEELSYPGVLYDITDIAALRHAFDMPAADEEITDDQWGSFMSGYAPIRDVNGETVAILGIDMDAEEYLNLAQSFFRPGVFLLIIVLGGLLSAYVAVLFWRRRVESMREFDAERSALINLALHQLGAPLAIFRWWVEILREGKGAESAAEHAEVVAQLEQGVERMSEVISSMEEVGSMEHAAVTASAEPVTMVSVIASVEEMFARRLKDADITVFLDIRDGGALVYIDSTILTGVLRELVGNAIDYSPRGSTITVATKRLIGGVQLSVRDEGCGIPKKDLPRLFTRFTRGSNASRIKPQGNGVGLFLVKQILDKVKGKIWIESTEGKGTIVHVVVPARR